MLPRWTSTATKLGLQTWLWYAAGAHVDELDVVYILWLEYKTDWQVAWLTCRLLSVIATDQSFWDCVRDNYKWHAAVSSTQSWHVNKINVKKFLITAGNLNYLNLTGIHYCDCSAYFW